MCFRTILKKEGYGDEKMSENRNKPKCFGNDAKDTIGLPCENCELLYECIEEAKRLGRNPE